MKKCTLLFCVFAFLQTAQAQNDDFFATWNLPVAPFHLIDNIYYVGAYDIGSYLIVGDEGHILVDGGLEETAPMIKKNVKALGFDMEDVKILLNTHAHYDHAAGLAELKAASGAAVYISEADADIVERGGKDDDVLGNEGLFPAVTVDRRLQDGETVVLGNISMTANKTGGHTRGCTTWTMQVDHEGETLDVVLVCSVSVLDEMRLVENPTYPDIVADFKDTFEKLESFPCDVFLAPHGIFIDLKGKIELLKTNPEKNPFIDPEMYRTYVARGKKRFEDRLAKEQAGGGR